MKVGRGTKNYPEVQRKDKWHFLKTRFNFDELNPIKFFQRGGGGGSTNIDMHVYYLLHSGLETDEQTFTH